MKMALNQIKDIDSRHAQEIIDFVSASKRGVSGYKRGTLLEKLFLDYPYFIRSKIETYDLIYKDFPPLPAKAA